MANLVKFVCRLVTNYVLVYRCRYFDEGILEKYLSLLHVSKYLD